MISRLAFVSFQQSVQHDMSRNSIRSHDEPLAKVVSGNLLPKKKRPDKSGLVERKVSTHPWVVKKC